MEKEMNRNRNNFGCWLVFQINKINKTQAYFERLGGLSASTICRWVKGSQPSIENYFQALRTLSKLTGVPVIDIVQETLDYMPYLVSYQVTPKKCPTCGQPLESK
jgi:hypothetical protein